jgi:hypothetical protein
MSPTTRTSRAAPSFSYQAAFINLEFLISSRTRYDFVRSTERVQSCPLMGGMTP